MSDENLLKVPDSKAELEVELDRLRTEIERTHRILDRVGSDSRNVKPGATEKDRFAVDEHELPARLNRYVAETQGALLKLLSGTGGFRG